MVLLKHELAKTIGKEGQSIRGKVVALPSHVQREAEDVALSLVVNRQRNSMWACAFCAYANSVSRASESRQKWAHNFIDSRDCGCQHEVVGRPFMQHAHGGARFLNDSSASETGESIAQQYIFDGGSSTDRALRNGIPDGISAPHLLESGQSPTYSGRMPALSSSPPPDDAAHHHHEMAESFGTAAEKYDRARPRYPTALIDMIVERLPGCTVLDVGIGTGISAEPFRSRGCAVLGVEPDLKMASLARAKGFAVETERFEEWDPAGRAFDGVIAGQTWHWVDPAAGAAKAATAMRPGSQLALFWNSGSPSPDVAARFAEIFASLETGLPFNPWVTSSDAQPYEAIIAEATAGLEATGAFGSVESDSFPWRASVSRDAWLEQTSTSGGINRLPKDKLHALLNGMATVIDDSGGMVDVNYTTVTVMAELKRVAEVGYGPSLRL